MANRIFIFILGGGNPDDSTATALAADGVVLAWHTADNKLWLREAMGLTFNSNPVHKKYQAHYPAGYELVDLIDASEYDLDRYPGFAEAYNLNHANP